MNNGNNASKSVFTVAGIFLIVSIALIITFTIYYTLSGPYNEGNICIADNNCLSTETCFQNKCQGIKCSSDVDCGPSAICANNRCYLSNCVNGNDCPDRTACIDGICLPVGTTCKSNMDCGSLNCFNNMCVECLSNSSCGTGQYCEGGSCRYPYEKDTAVNMINFVSPAQDRGNIIAPPGYYCPIASANNTPICGDELGEPISCGPLSTCPASCPYCVNGTCRCIQGDIYENCSSNKDCQSGACKLTKYGNICVGTGGSCAFNYDSANEDCIGCCPSSQPYCIEGVCSTSSLGAICGSSNVPDDLCSSSLSLGVPGTKGFGPDNMGYVCVNGRCGNTPGRLNDQCSSNASCASVNPKTFICTPQRTTLGLRSRCL